MKKKVIVALTIFVLIFACVTVWLFGYYNRKSNDNLPSLYSIARMEEADANEILVGYHSRQLIEVWGEPTFCNKNEYIWQNGNITITVNTNNKNKVVVCGISRYVDE